MTRSSGSRLGTTLGAAGLAAAITIAGLLVASPPANAATLNVTVDCQGPLTVSADPGDQIVFELSSDCPLAVSVSPTPPGPWGGYVASYPTSGFGYLDLVSAANYDAANTVLGFWDVRSNGLGTTTVTTTLLEANASPAALEVGATIGYTGINGMTQFEITYGGPRQADSPGATHVPDPTVTLTSNPDDRGMCWPTVSGLGGTWVQLTDSGCVPATSGGTLLGWATSPDFPVARAKNGVVVDEDFAGVRMIFIPLNGYTLLSSDNTLYPIWSM